MKYNFDHKLSRENSSCVKYDLRKVVFGNENVLPMWVADMDIPTPDFILNAITSRCKHPVLGYSFRDKEYHQAIVQWQQKRHGWVIDPEWISFCPGVVAGINHIINALTEPADRIIIQPPVYHPFFSTVRNNGRELLLNPLLENNGYYQIDFANLEELFKTGAKMLILSSPHNPVGRVWNKDELIKLGDLCLQYNVLVISDEIHSDLVFKPNIHHPFASLKKEYEAITITLGAPSKTFNTAGLSTGYVIIPDALLLKKYNAILESTGAGLGNVFGIEALKSAYSPKGEEWLEELLIYLQHNIDIVGSYLKSNLPDIRFHFPEGTYMIWLDFRKLQISEQELNKKLIETAGLGFNSGSQFGSEGTGFQRMNIACPKSLVEEAMHRMRKTFIAS